MIFIAVSINLVHGKLFDVNLLIFFPAVVEKMSFNVNIPN